MVNFSMMTFLFFIVLPIGLCVLEIFLSRMDNKYIGLILPAITFIYSLIALLSFAIFDGATTGEIVVSMLTTFLGTNLPTLILLGIYFLCRENMQPARWYYKVGEKLPERISFTPVYTVDDFQYRKTAGLQMLENLRDEYTYSGLAEKFSINYYQLKNMLSKRTNPVTGKRCYKILPQEHFVIKLRDVINPDYWFIFPEELENHLDKS